MKNKALSLLGIFVAFLFLFSACEKTEIEKANEDYNFDDVIPMIFDFTGPTVLPASGLGSVEYRCVYRGGSTYSFTSEGHTATITIKEGYPNIAEVAWDQSSVDVQAKLYVVETTSGGKTSDPDTLAITLTAFCPLVDLNDLVGTWTGDDSEGNPTQVVTFVDGSNFMINGLNVGWMVGYWGEIIVDQVPLIMIMNENGTLEIELQYYMETTWNGAPQPTYSIAATGVWDNCLKTMTIDYDLYQGGSVLTSITENITLLP